MTKHDDSSPEKPAAMPLATPPPTAPPAVGVDIENQAPSTSGGGVSVILRRWKREDFLKRGSLALRGLALLFSLLSFIVAVSNKHGDGENFTEYEEYRYLLVIAILSTLYAGGQALRQVNELPTGKHLFRPRTASMVDFFGDQIMAYLLISATSAAIPVTNWMREEADNIFTDSSASAICMAFLAFVALALSAIISGYKLSNQSSF